jgi:hypothetical protein
MTKVEREWCKAAGIKPLPKAPKAPQAPAGEPSPEHFKTLPMDADVNGDMIDKDGEDEDEVDGKDLEWDVGGKCGGLGVDEDSRLVSAHRSQPLPLHLPPIPQFPSKWYQTSYTLS